MNGSATARARVPAVALSVAGAREVDGVGHAAFYEPRTTTLTAVSGEVVFTIRAKVIPEPPDVVEHLCALGVAAADRIDT